ncbi:hypothetical protein OJF2_44300 [Aquisphaera giovannonii]|uniref:WLM domain protein n=1 Tax=Aquisphaera giovannonii TaxID=406548 RepID=A0A5B9W5J6_9BACT|nr:hypothetical protein [Aquisphaera giovannonii]QEH35873.1 hypothetical protein OJF2_44300 [Aquisphaera giovannonii]
MPRINKEGSKHESNFRTRDGNTWEPFKDAGHIKLVTAAFLEIDRQVLASKTTLKACNAAFSRLPNRRDFAALWKDPGIWVSYNSNTEEGLYGITYKNDISIADYVFTLKEPVRWIAATLIHELAHVNGAPGTLDSKAAEETLPPCGFDDKYNPATVGARMRRVPIFLG